jgi:(p)ppGpp synthase/HD superfamily hydrolase
MAVTSESSVLLKTLVFAADKHRNQRRKDTAGTPYINHPIGVASILANEAGINDVTVLQAAILHDTIEDTNTTLEELRSIFGPVVATIVAEVTDDKSLPKEKRKELQVEHAKHISREAKLVKMADKIHNLRDLVINPPPGWSVERIQGYFIWSRAVMDGCRGINSPMDQELDRLFQFIPPGDRQTQLENYYASMKTAGD